MTHVARVWVAGALLYALAHTAAIADEWPQWGGTDRNFRIAARVSPWTSGCPRELWRRPLGPGFSSVIADRERLYTMYRKGDQEVVVALDPGNGGTLWEHAYEAPYLKGMDMDTGTGPHATPLAVGGRLFTAGVTGRLRCLDSRTGKLIWERKLIEDLGGDVMNRGYSGSPIAYQDLVIATAGGTGHALVAFNQKDGRVVWQKHDFRNSHASPILIRIEGQDQLVAVLSKVIVGIDPKNGELLWSHPNNTSGEMIASTPVWSADGILVVSAAYDGGSRALRLVRHNGTTTAQELWAHKQLRVHHTNIVRAGDYFYGSNGDFGATFFTAVRASTGEVASRSRAFNKAGIVLVADKAIVLDEEGHVNLATLKAGGVEVHVSCPVLRHRAWTPPTVVGDRLYVRDEKEIAAFALQ